MAKSGTAFPRHLYVHIPFCRSRCAYCDFASEPVAPHLRAGRVEEYVDRLRAELRARARVEEGIGAGKPPERADERLFDTVYLGGGTPTVLPRDLLLPLVAELAGLQRRSKQREFTVETNPGTVDERLLNLLLDAGATRVSLGVQSFSAALRAALGRHTPQLEIESALRAMAAVGVGPGRRGGSRAARAAAGPLDWNIDLVFGIPGQTWPDAAADIDAAVAARPDHISLYDLTYTTAFAARVARIWGAGARRAAGAFAEDYLPAAAARLEAAGYRRYEVSNFALPGGECRHNLAYWRGEDYLGIGVAAVSTVGGERRTNPATVAGYLGGEPPSVEELSPRTRLWEKAMLGLRTAEGVDELEVSPVLEQEALERLSGQDCLHRRCGRLRVNPAFLDVSNTVISALLASPESHDP